MPTATSVSVKGRLLVEIRYDDGRRVEIDLAPKLHGPIFEPLRHDPALFQSVHVDELGALEWDNGASLAPEFVSGLARFAVSA